MTLAELPSIRRSTTGVAAAGEQLQRHLGDWEDLLALIVAPEGAELEALDRKRRLLSFLLRREGIDEAGFWTLSRSQRSRLFLSRYSRLSREIPSLEISSFDLDKIAKERFRHEPLTLGAAWHYGFWRSYFSHAAITHPANDGLREEFSTAWHIGRRAPAVLFKSAHGERLEHVHFIELDMPILIGPLPYSDGHTLELAWLRAIAAAGEPHQGHKTRSLVVVPAEALIAQREAFQPHAPWILPRLSSEDVDDPKLTPILESARLIEVVWGDGAPVALADLRRRWPGAWLSVYIEADSWGERLWDSLEQAAGSEGVAMIHLHSGSEKSYRLVPKVDQFLKRRLLRARVQLVSAGGTTDTHASAATAWEAVLLGANGASMTHLASLALVPELVDVHHGANPRPIVDRLADRPAGELSEQALSTLACWQHSILDFLSCMGIDDAQKTSGNTMAITMTRDWLREVDGLASEEFARENRELNDLRLRQEPVPAQTRERFKVSRLMSEVATDLPEVLGAHLLAHESASWHLANTNRSLTADFLEVLYRMAAGAEPRVEDFFVEGDLGPLSIDGIRVKLSRESVAWSLERLRRDPSCLDYISLAVPRGFHRPGAVPPHAHCELRSAAADALASFQADEEGGFEIELEAAYLRSGENLRLIVRRDGIAEAGAAGKSNELEEPRQSYPELFEIELLAADHGAHGASVLRASKEGTIVLSAHPRGGWRLRGHAVRAPIWQGPVGHASISLGAASQDFLESRIEGNSGLAFTSSGEGGPLRLASEEAMAWETLQAASGHFGIEAGDLRRVRDVEIKINQGAKPGKGGRLSGAKVSPQVSRARNIPIGTNALSPDPKHDIYSIEDMPAEVWLWLGFHNHCGIKIAGSSYTRFVAAGMWSNFVVDYLLIDSGLGGSGNYHADSSHVGWPDLFRSILSTHHALVHERVDLDGTGKLRPIRDANGAAYGAQGGTRLMASGGVRSELDVLKILIAGADAVVEASIGKAVAFGCNQCGNCHLDCPRGGITTKPELTVQNERDLMRRRFRNWTLLDLVKLAVLIDALNREQGALDKEGRVLGPEDLLKDVRELRGRVDLLEMPDHGGPDPDPDSGPEQVSDPESEHDSCRVGSLAASVPVTVHAVCEAARLSHNGGNNRGGGIGFAGFAPPTLRDHTCVMINTLGGDREDTLRSMLGHFAGCRFFDAYGSELTLPEVLAGLDSFRIPVRESYAEAGGWRAAGLREDPGDFHLFFVELEDSVLASYGQRLLGSSHWLQRRTKYGDFEQATLAAALVQRPAPKDERLVAFLADVREEYFTALAHLLDTRYYRTWSSSASANGVDKEAAGKYSAGRRGHIVSLGEDLAAIKIGGWTHLIPEYFELEQFWADYPGAAAAGGVEVRGRALRTFELYAHVWGLHHRYPTNSPALDAEGRGNPAGAHPFKSYNLLLMHNGEQVAVDSTAPFLCEFGYVHGHPSMGPEAADYEGDSCYERKALTDTEYAAYLFDFTRRVLGLNTEEASQVISPITGLDLDSFEPEHREKLMLLMRNYVQLTPTGPYKFTVLQTSHRAGHRIVGFRENMDIKFLRPHEIVSHRDLSPGGPEAVANGSEAKIADAMLRVLHERGVLKDSASDLRFNMRAGGRPGYEEHGGVFEAFVVPDALDLTLVNRFGEPVLVKRAGHRVDLSIALRDCERLADPHWMQLVEELVEGMLSEAAPVSAGRAFGPDDELPAAAEALVQVVLQHLRVIGPMDYRYLVEVVLPRAARAGDPERALTLRVLTELRKQLAFSDLGDKALASLEYLTDGGRDAEGGPEGGIMRILDDVPPLARAWGRSRFVRLDADTRDDLAGPAEAEHDVLVVNLRGFESESFTLASASRFVSACVRAGWRNFILYDARGGPRYLATNLAQADGTPAHDVTFEVYGREHGDFLGALLEGARVFLYGQAQSHIGFKADSGYLFVLQDALNTCMYSAHGGTFSTWDSGSRFAVAGQNKLELEDGSPAPGFRSIHFGSPNEYAFEYLMSGGENSSHVVLGLKKPDAKGELSLRPKPYMGKFLLSGAAAGRVFLLDPERRMDPAQHRGNESVPISRSEWDELLAPFLESEARRRGVPLRIEGETLLLRLEGQWNSWHFNEAFVQLVPSQTARTLEAARIAAGEDQEPVDAPA